MNTPQEATPMPTELPSVAELRKHGTRALATYVRDVLANRTVEATTELEQLERAVLNADLDRWLERQNEAHAEMQANNEDMTPKGRVLFWTARERYDRAQREVDRAWRRLHDAATPVATTTSDAPLSSSKKRNTPKEKK